MNGSCSTCSSYVVLRNNRVSVCGLFLSSTWTLVCVPARNIFVTMYLLVRQSPGLSTLPLASISLWTWTPDRHTLIHILTLPHTHSHTAPPHAHTLTPTHTHSHIVQVLSLGGRWGPPRAQCVSCTKKTPGLSLLFIASLSTCQAAKVSQWSSSQFVLKQGWGQRLIMVLIWTAVQDPVYSCYHKTGPTHTTQEERSETRTINMFFYLHSNTIKPAQYIKDATSSWTDVHLCIFSCS